MLGGGVAGIAAAVTLSEQGRRPLLIESRPWLGGRTRSFHHPETGDEIDNGQHLLMGCYHETLQLLEQLGTRDLLTLQPSLSVEFRNTNGTQASLTAPPTVPSPLNVLIAMLRFKPLTFSERLGLIRLGLHTRFKGPRGDETVEAYLSRLRQSPQTRRLLWDPIVLATLNTIPAEASATLFAQVMRLGFLGSGQDSKLALPRAGLSQLFGNPAEQFITQKGGIVITGSPVIEVIKQDDEFRVVTRSKGEFRTKTLISALPWRGFNSLIAPLLPTQNAAPTDVCHNPIISVYLWFDRNLNHVPEFAAMNGGIVEWIFNRRKIVPELNEQYPGLLCCVISAANQQAQRTNAELVAITEQELRSTFPEIGEAQLLTAQVIKEKHATFAATLETEALRPNTHSGLPGLYLAGDWTATGLPGTIEGAVQSGNAAAKQAGMRAEGC